jgi:2-amino-4-hydroxy-6-hydroxymethyldihydropteridine diphosphokinase
LAEDRSVPVAIALGSNLGDRRAHLESAVAQLAGFIDRLRVSTIRETEPVDVPDPQPPYLNAVVTGQTALEPDELLRQLVAIEEQRGRTRPFSHAPRTLDLDLILYGDRVIDHGELIVPHPRFRERRFVLEPLADVAPGWVDPVTRKTVAQLLDQLV